MYRREPKNQLKFEDFYLPFGGQLNPENRWVILAKKIDWDLIEELYVKNFPNPEVGNPAKDSRIAFGSLIIKERLNLSDEETVNQISENPYLQYFIGSHEYEDKCPFGDTSMVYFRKRFTREDYGMINAKIISDSYDKQNDSQDDDTDKPNSGKLIVDASCCPSDITYPTDLNLLNDAREKTEKMIDVMHKPSIGLKRKPRTYRKKARKDYLAVAKQKSPGKNKLLKAIRKQLGYLQRNLKIIAQMASEGLLSLLDNILYRKLLVISELYRQQQYMYNNKIHTVSDRIVSISQPHIRPIVRGKARNKTEFGAKISISLIDGFSYLDTICWDNYSESTELISQIEAYKDRTGCYPESVHAGKTYRNQTNREFCAKNGIRLSGPALGRPPKDKEKSKAIRKQQYKDEIDRIPVEGKFGQGKRRFGLGLIKTKLIKTAVSSISLAFIVMNLEKILKNISLFASLLWNMLVAGMLIRRLMPGIIRLQPNSNAGLQLKIENY